MDWIRSIGKVYCKRCEELHSKSPKVKPGQCRHCYNANECGGYCNTCNHYSYGSCAILTLVPKVSTIRRPVKTTVDKQVVIRYERKTRTVEEPVYETRTVTRYETVEDTPYVTYSTESVYGYEGQGQYCRYVQTGTRTIRHEQPRYREVEKQETEEYLVGYEKVEVIEEVPVYGTIQVDEVTYVSEEGPIIQGEFIEEWVRVPQCDCTKCNRKPNANCKFHKARPIGAEKYLGLLKQVTPRFLTYDNLTIDQSESFPRIVPAPPPPPPAPKPAPAPSPAPAPAQAPAPKPVPKSTAKPKPKSKPKPKPAPPSPQTGRPPHRKLGGCKIV